MLTSKCHPTGACDKAWDSTTAPRNDDGERVGSDDGYNAYTLLENDANGMERTVVIDGG